MAREVQSVIRLPLITLPWPPKNSARRAIAFRRFVGTYWKAFDRIDRGIDYPEPAPDDAHALAVIKASSAEWFETAGTFHKHAFAPSSFELYVTEPPS
jgi:hypothetical protein